MSLTRRKPTEQDRPNSIKTEVINMAPVNENQVSNDVFCYL